MTVKQVVLEFYEMLLEGRKGRTPETYKKKVEVLIEYLQKEEGLNDNSCRSVFVSMEELKLFSKEPSQPLKEEEYERLLNLCNEKINNAEIDDLIREGYNSTYTYFISAIATKLVLFTGIKNNALMFDFETGRKYGVAVGKFE